MADTKEQKIVVFTELHPSDEKLISHGIKIASVFNKELCLVYRGKKREKNQNKAILRKLQNYAAPSQYKHPELKVSCLLFYESWSKLPDILAIDYEAIVLIANAENFKSYSRALSESPVPFLFVRPYSEIKEYNHLVQPIDMRTETGDSSLWCSYFGRFNKAEIVVVAARDKAKSDKRQLTKNIKITARLYKKFAIKHSIYKGAKSSFGISSEAIEFALASDCNLFVMLGSSSITLLDLLVGLPERKVIKRAGNLPVMVINPRRDNYILCD